jgi:AbrB family looped-hinge helix DNA binding protein
MRTTIDSAGRVVVPKQIRDAMGLSAGREIDVVFTEGRIEIEVAPARVRIEAGEVPRVVAEDELPPLTDEQVREALEGTRR